MLSYQMKNVYQARVFTIKTENSAIMAQASCSNIHYFLPNRMGGQSYNFSHFCARLNISNWHCLDKIGIA